MKLGLKSPNPKAAETAAARRARLDAVDAWLAGDDTLFDDLFRLAK